MSSANVSIPIHRTGVIRVRTRPGATVRVEQTRHAFQFGTVASHRCLLGKAGPEQSAAYREIVRTYFNAIIPVGLFWSAVEPESGVEQFDVPDACLAWAEQHGFDVRGHCLFYSTDIHNRQWVRELSDDERLAAMERHARRMGRRYKGRIPEWDISNEMLDDVDWFRSTYGDEIVRDMARWLREEDPEAVVYFNEHDILTGGDADLYVELIERMLELGVPLGGIGCQGHLDYPADLSQVTTVLDKLAQFGLPIKVTEFDIGVPLKYERYRGVNWIRGAEKDKDLDKFASIVASYGEEYEPARAQSLRDFYRLLFGHRAVTGILMWDFWESTHWRTKGALFREDFSPYPAGEAYMDLVRKEWWTQSEAQADADGLCEVVAVCGRHAVSADGATVEADVPTGGGTVEVTVAAS